MYFLERKFWYFLCNFTEGYSYWSSWQEFSIGTGNGLAPNRCQAITCTNDDPIHVWIHVWQPNWPASFSPVGLNLWPNCLQCWLMTLSRLSTQVQIPVGLSVPGHYTCIIEPQYYQNILFSEDGTYRKTSWWIHVHCIFFKLVICQT